MRNAVLTRQAFHINTVHDSQVNFNNSRSVRIISVVGMVFIPFSAVSTIFGTQFFSAENISDEGSMALHMKVNPDFWMLWAIALPLTLIILSIWRLTEYRNTVYSEYSSSGLGVLDLARRGSKMV